MKHNKEKTCLWRSLSLAAPLPAVRTTDLGEGHCHGSLNSTEVVRRTCWQNLLETHFLEFLEKPTFLGCHEKLLLERCSAEALHYSGSSLGATDCHVPRNWDLEKPCLLQVPWQAAHRNPKAKPFLLLSLPRPLEAKLNTQLGKRKIQGPDSFSDMRQKR
jgi:hypothetical protein